jgi:hypothetical protein
MAAAAASSSSLGASGGSAPSSGRRLAASRSPSLGRFGRVSFGFDRLRRMAALRNEKTRRGTAAGDID